ncbi:hypothetical protein MTO96_042329 [Rhipicephalus appendiculatus]
MAVFPATIVDYALDKGASRSHADLSVTLLLTGGALWSYRASTDRRQQKREQDSVGVGEFLSACSDYAGSAFYSFVPGLYYRQCLRHNAARLFGGLEACGYCRLLWHRERRDRLGIRWSDAATATLVQPIYHR